MILAIDIGNSNIVIGYIKNDNILMTERIETEYCYSVDECTAGIKDILEKWNIKIDKIKGSIISSVVPGITDILKVAVIELTNITPLVVTSELITGLHLLTENLNQLGSDRIVDAVAAANYYGKPVIIFDMGTATTVSVVDENSNFLGGMIMLGVKSSLKALANKAAQLPNVDLEECRNLIGKNTIECMQSGSIYGSSAMVDGIIRRIKNEVGQNATVVATGGLSELIIPHCEEEIIHDEHLLLKGLYLLYMKNCNDKELLTPSDNT